MARLIQEQAIDNLVAVFEAEVQRIAAEARRETLRFLQDRLGTTDGVIDRTQANARLMTRVEDTFKASMRGAGYDELVNEFVGSFNGQFEYFSDVVENLGEQIGRNLTVTFGERDKALFLQQQNGAKDLLQQAVDIQAKAAQQQALFSVGAVKASALTALISEKLDMTPGRASAIADTSLSTFYRTIADRGYRQIEKQLGKNVDLVYRYGGPNDKLTRRVCREWLAGTAEHGWTREKIEGLSNGQLANVFLTAGGFRCRHQWLAVVTVAPEEKAQKPQRAAKPEDPAKGFLTREEYNRFKRVRTALGDKLQINGWEHPQVQDHVRDLSLLPEYVAKRLAAKDVTVQVGTGSVTNFAGFEHLKGVQPRGWEPGSTWDEVDGLFDQRTRTAVLGTDGRGVKRFGLHECGHGLASTEYWESDFFGPGKEMVDHHKRLYDAGKLRDYYKQGGPGGAAGRSELWAEALSDYWKHGYAKTAQMYDRKFAGFLRESLKMIRDAVTP